MNLLGLWLLAHGRQGNLNMRGAWLHVLSDALGSVGAMVAGLVIWAWGWRLADPLVSAVIAVLVLRSAWFLLQEAVGVLMESAPAHIDVAGVREAIRGVAGVIDVHDLHVWSIGSGQIAMSGDVVATFDGRYAALLLDVKALLQARFGISHATIQMEPPGFGEQDLHP